MNSEDYKSILAQNEVLKKELKRALDQFRWAVKQLEEAQNELQITKMLLIRAEEGK